MPDPPRRSPASSSPRRRSGPLEPLPPRKPVDPARRRAIVRGLLLSVILVGALFAFVYPTQTFLDQRDSTNNARQQLSVLDRENKKLAEAADRLRSDDEITRIARQYYGLVKPGERPFVILSAPTTTTAPAGAAGSTPPGQP